MGGNLKASREGRAHRRPDLECLEDRQLLSLTDPLPAASSSVVRSDGTVNYDQVIQAGAARATYGVDGSGGNVAVIDTGVDYRNPAFGTGSIGSSGNKVIAGVDFTGSPNGVIPTWQHGTGVAGLIASNDSQNPGVAPGAGIVALRVFGDNNQGSFDKISQALEWVEQNHIRYNITAVNLSVSDGGNYLANIFANDLSVGQTITQDVQSLAAANIPVVVASGNNFDGKSQGQGFSSIIPDTISVTATDETKMTGKRGDPLAADAQRLGAIKGGVSGTDIAAPGVDLIAPSGASGTAVEEGTSFATPQVTGTVLLLQQMYRQAFGTLPTVKQLDGWLTAGADSIHDSITGIDLGRLNVAGSLGVLANQIQAVKAAAIPAIPVVVIPTIAVPTVATPTVEVATAVVSTPVASPTLVSPPTVVTPPLTTPTTAPTTITTPTTTAPTAPEPTTEVFVNGASVGNIATSKLSEKYARLFALSKGNQKELRAWAPPGSVIDLGGVQPSGTVAHPKGTVFSVRARQANHPNKIVNHSVTHPLKVSHHATSPNKPTVASDLVTAQVLRGFPS